MDDNFLKHTKQVDSYVGWIELTKFSSFNRFPTKP